ncbi:hypothetical protein [Streptomyces sp. NPDC002205]|uniref:hypothetical protein n=1 Tax=Streptomyces sp. NPDC002205 TaxID=3154411 RepID=UPI00332CCEAA
MSGSGGWFVVIEEIGREFGAVKTVPVEGGAEEAWDAALEVARSHQHSSRPDATREIYRLSERELMVALREIQNPEWPFPVSIIVESFRVSVAELAEVHEPPEPQEIEEPADQKRRLWRRSRP